jgi:hypothetical protein
MLIQNHQKQIQSLNQTRMMSLIQSLNQLQLQAQYPDLLILIQSPSQTLTLNLS